MTIKQLGELKVEDCMAAQAIVIDQSAKLTDAIRLMDAESLSLLPVVQANMSLVGVLSATDLLEVTREIQADLSTLDSVNERTREFLLTMLIDQGDTTLVKDVMTSPAVSVHKTVNMVVAARMLIDNQCHHLPVVDEEETPIGVISSSDFVRAFAEFGATLAG